MALAKFRLHQALRVAHATQAQVTHVRLAGHQRHGHLVAELALAQVRIEDERELVRRTEAAGALRCADDDRTGISDELFVGLPGMLGVTGGAHGLGMSRLPVPGP